jgi:hypothetical protein
MPGLCSRVRRPPVPLASLNRACQRSRARCRTVRGGSTKSSTTAFASSAAAKGTACACSLATAVTRPAGRDAGDRALIMIMVQEKPIGWLIEVKGGGHGVRRGRFAVLTSTLQRAKILVGAHVAVTNQRLEFDRALRPEEVGKLGLKPDEVREYAPKPPVDEQNG